MAFTPCSTSLLRTRHAQAGLCINPRHSCMVPKCWIRRSSQTSETGDTRVVRNSCRVHHPINLHLLCCQQRSFNTDCLGSSFAKVSDRGLCLARGTCRVSDVIERWCEKSHMVLIAFVKESIDRQRATSATAERHLQLHSAKSPTRSSLPAPKPKSSTATHPSSVSPYHGE